MAKEAIRLKNEVQTLGRCSRHIQQGGHHGPDPKYAGGVIYPIWPGNVLAGEFGKGKGHLLCMLSGWI